MNNEIIIKRIHLSLKTAKARETGKFEKEFSDGYYDGAKAAIDNNLNEDVEIETPSAWGLGYKYGVDDTKAIIVNCNITEG